MAKTDVTDNNLDKKKKKEDKNKDYTFSAYPHLLEIKPREKYIFHSDYFEVDSKVACILSFFHIDGATDNFGAFWGINRIPVGLPDGVTTICFEQVRRMSDTWITDHQSRAEGISQMNENEQGKAGTNASRGKANRTAKDLSIISQELQDGAAYLNVHYRLLIKANNIHDLDEAIKKIDRLYIDRFATLSAAPYMGEQRQELSNLFMKNQMKRGKGYYFTSTEFAGSYSLVTHGLEDEDGEYVGYMTGDVNNSAVLFNPNRYNHHVIVANENYDETNGRAHVSDYWGSKISQSCMLNCGRVVHLIFDGAKLDTMGPSFQNLSYKIDMNKGDVNMFEMFGDVKDELSIFASQMQKLILMAEQCYETTDQDRSIIRTSLEEVATRFYIDNRMWYENAASNRDKLRVVGIPHDQLPKLEMFVSYLDTAYKAVVNASAKDEEQQHALSVLRGTFKSMLSNNGDLFNTTTTDVIDGAKTGRRVIYDFSDLMIRGSGIAMAQFVNVIGFAVGNLGKDDTVIIHGTELIQDRIKDYVTTQFNRLYDKGGRVCFLYNDMDKMIADKGFSHFDKANYTVFGNMTENFAKSYQESLGQDIPADLIKLVTAKGDDICYIRRGFDNVVFYQDLSLGISKGKVSRI